MNGRQTHPAENSRALEPDHDAAAWLDEHGDAMFRYARSRVRNREVAEDLVQDTFVAALQSQDQFQQRATIRTWLLSILRNKIVDHYRRKEDRATMASANPTDQPDSVRNLFFAENGIWKTSLGSRKSPDKVLDDQEFWETLDHCLGQLPQPFAEAFILRELEQIKSADLRQILGVTESNLRVRLHRARLLLRACLQKHGLDHTSHTSKRTS